jgi:3D-(3,5/4)-trihydroxycyclohexane-1,2-dione acylhydrolase (decyclizing)
MAQALVRFLNQQYVSVDGDEMPFVEGVATIFGHGNVLGIGQALEQDPGHLQVMQGCNEQGIAHMATDSPNSTAVSAFSPSPPPSGRAPPIW